MTKWPFNKVVVRVAVPIIVVFLVATGLIGLVGGGSQVDDNVLEGNMLTAESSILQDLRPGNTLHIVYQQYQRHGSKAEVIQADPDTLPEFHTIKVWMRFDDQGALVEQRTLILDQEGKAVQEEYTVGEEHLVVNLKTGESTRRYIGSDRIVTIDSLSQLSAAAHIQKLQEQNWQILGTGSLMGIQTTILEERRAWAAPFSDSADATSFTIPWTNDLSPTEWVRNLEIGVDNPFIHDERMWVVDAKGVRTLVEQRRIVSLEIQY